MLAGILLLCTAAAGTPLRAAPKPDAAPALKYEVGKEVTIDDAAMFDKHFILYVPKDYTPDREWPLIFCYHGVNQTAKVWPFKELTDGKGYIVVGMSYLAERGGPDDQEWASLQRIGKLVAGSLKVNPRMIMIGGFSLGGGWTYRLSNKDPSMFAAICALGMSGGPDTGKAAAFAGKPVMVAHGETDEYCQKIQPTLDGYTKVGAVLTHEVFKGQGHTVDTKNAVLKKWLLDVGPLKGAKADLMTAQATEKAGKIGPALSLYQAVAKADAGGEYAKAAADAAKAITDAADKKFADADAAVAEK
jgi:dienelactone hydrolase